MDTETKEKLALTGELGARGAAIRLTAARLFTGMTQEELGEKVGVRRSTISNIEKGRSFPTRALMSYLFREHRIDFNFLIYGSFSQLPADVLPSLFQKLEDAHNVWGQRPSSD